MSAFIRISSFLILAVISLSASAADLPPETRSSWNSWHTPVLVLTHGAPNHRFQDTIANPGSELNLSGHFLYGRLAKSLEGETVSIWIKPLNGAKAGSWKKIGERNTDTEGAISVSVPATVLEGATRAQVTLMVRGDLSHADGVIHIVPRGQKTVVFDIDGTLTRNDAQLWEQVLLGLDPEPNAGAAEISRLYAAAGFEIYYLTGRPYLLDSLSRAWLADHGFAPGLLKTTESLIDVTPDEAHVQRYKREVLQSLSKAAGLRYVVVYGNAPTDVCAYAQSGIDPSRTFIIGPNGGTACPGFAASQAIRSFTEHRPVAEKIAQSQ